MKKYLILLTALLFLPLIALAGTGGPLNPNANNTGALTNPAGLQGSGSGYATYLGSSFNVNTQYTFPTFSIPSNATITGFSTTVVGHASSGGTDASIQFYLSKNGIGGTFNNTGTELTNTLGTGDITYTFGNSTDLWGTTGWTPAIVNSTNFALYVGYAYGSSIVISGQNVLLTVYYTQPPLGPATVTISHSTIIKKSTIFK